MVWWRLIVYAKVRGLLHLAMSVPLMEALRVAIHFGDIVSSLKISCVLIIKNDRTSGPY